MAQTQLTPEVIQAKYDEIRELYLSDKRPWVIGFSGGKDSTTILQLTWYALKALPKEKLNKPVFVISSDTLVETPLMVNLIDASMENIDQAAQKDGIPFQAHRIFPEIKQSFWVNLLGKGYPTPSNNFRWCTNRLKIEPANRFILDKVAEFGEVIMVLGSRKAESVTRAQVMSLHKIKDSILSRHTTLPNAFCYTPIEDFTKDDVWGYLLQVPNPWGNNNKDLLAFYQSAQAGECPLVVDTTTGSCGNSRFGCWVCTVVDKDTSMESLIENGETWLKPMLDFRNFLAMTKDPAVKSKYREYKRRDGSVKFTKDGRLIRGPYKFEVRKDFLKQLLQIQKDIEDLGKKIEIIRMLELKEIRSLWLTEEQDWDDSLPKIYHEVYGKEMSWERDDYVSFSQEDKYVLSGACREVGLDPTLVARLIDAERQLHGMSRRSTIFSTFDEILGEEWRSEEEMEHEASRKQEEVKRKEGIDAA